MKALVFCACILILASFSLAEIKQQLKTAISNAQNEANICMEENNMSRDDWYNEEEIMTNLYNESGNEERKRKNGCTIECVMKKLNLMEGSNIKEAKVHADISKEMEGSPMEGKAHKIARDCMKEVRSITQECEKGFSLFTCVVKAVHKMQKHEEHTTTKIEEREGSEQAE